MLSSFERRDDTAELVINSSYGVSDRLELGVFAGEFVNKQPTNTQETDVDSDSLSHRYGLSNNNENRGSDLDELYLNPSLKYMVRPISGSRHQVC